ncbi:MAG: outer membrane protein assembly factor BamE [Legionellaceae bacterium]|nr:outer membrane protein assembly factor BamE [Legionellaceae bacterium]
MAKFSDTGKKMRYLISGLRVFSGLLLTLLLTHCASYDFSRRIVQQGNLIPQHKIDRLHLGMPKQDVAILMGSSMLSPLFNNDRWDYVYTWRKGAGRLEKRYLVLHFKNDRLRRIDKNLQDELHHTI